jgi:hypothetical protein
VRTALPFLGLPHANDPRLDAPVGFEENSFGNLCRFVIRTVIHNQNL